jgi:hypothetical protein
VGLLGSVMKAGVAKKVWDEARKPKNQAMAKDAFRRVTGTSGDGKAPRR